MKTNYKATYFIISILSLIPMFVFSQACVPATFKQVFYQNDSTQNPKNTITRVVTASDSNYFIGGSQITKADLYGNNLWNGLSFNNYKATDAIPYYSPDGRYLVLEGNFHFSNVDANDNVIWQNYLVDTTCYCMHPKHIVQTADGGFIIAGYKTILDTTFYRDRIFIVKTNTSGDTTWTKTIAKSPYDDDAYYIQQTTDGGYIVVANVEVDNAGQIFKVGILKLNSSGQEQWYKTASNSIFYQAAINAIQTNDSACAIIAATDSITAGTCFIKIKENGTIVSSNLYIGLNYNGGLAQLSNNTFLIGMHDSLYTIDETTNTIIQTKSYNGVANEKIPLNTIQPTCDGGYVLAGNTSLFKSATVICGSSFNYYHYFSYLIKTDSTLADVAVTSGINNLDKNNLFDVSVFPNPFLSETTVAFSTTNNLQPITISITDVLGNHLKAITFKGNQFVFEKGDLKAGVYFLNFRTENYVINKKIVVQ